MAEGIGDMLRGMFGVKKDLRTRPLNILGRYNLQDMESFATEFPDLAAELSLWGATLRNSRDNRKLYFGRSEPSKQRMVPTVSILEEKGKYYLQYMQEWRDARGMPDTRVTTAGNRMEIPRRQAMRIRKRFKRFDESGKFPD